MQNREFCSIVLAAGAGTRMKSEVPKMMHKVAHKSMIEHVLDQIDLLQPIKNYIVYGYKGEMLQDHLSARTNLIWAYQDKQLGTAHATKVAADLIAENVTTLVLFSDNPLIKASTLEKLLEQVEQGADLALLTTYLDNPYGYGRVVKDANGNICAIVEQKDSNPEQQAIKEVYTGILAINSKNLQNLLAQVDNKNANNEYYLTDIIKLASQAGQKVTSVATTPLEVSSANTKFQLAQLEDYYQQSKMQELAEQGLSLRSTMPGTFALRGELTFDEDCEVDLNCQFNGQVQLGKRVKIGQGCIITNATIGDDTVIEPYTIIENASVGNGCAIGPFARLRPNSQILDKAKVGNFVETKNTTLGVGSKANHLAYLGDTTVGSKVNIGAGVITCNYDGANKFKTIIGDNVFVGSDCQLVAPVTIADGATIAAGTTVLKNVEGAYLVLNPKQTKVNPDWQRPEKIKK
ncbi:bifunctional UDP-N-acetylglucosamine diphosphorylase/glucosamine-1-phosphate N-acetyltransferase GlmU [Psittacicella hinzii]|uniref:Bifunctional protein GlmU n=1 Tax=Psittacicella hinzii TaxID=2028575 RepID=A0A3A1YH08_9GAMM|nr:bifunctional UDP-N-acetylglucosamine diphosphorylase/glucosamine-1-phosphate N-acetyltransferase GlmU [Psittacicella hinzii]RIY36478.1 UDP-N-acetylglucosamine diphosphorylase/glucosamine-1-phosphate N-acetyltransferase [Psittacicella hinzii]